jgi:general secretion pathway protein H
MKASRDRGFTLLEILLVVIVITLVMAVSYPALSRGSMSLRLRATSRDVLNTIRFAREKAVTEQTGMLLTVDREKQQLILTDSLGEGARTYSLPKDVQIQRLSRAGTEVTDGPLLVRFLPNGSADQGEIILAAKSGAWLGVATDPITGGGRIFSSSSEKKP